MVISDYIRASFLPDPLPPRPGSGVHWVRGARPDLGPSFFVSWS